MKHQSKFRENRAEKDGASKPEGKRAEANQLKGVSPQQEESLEEQIAPGIHQQVQSKARELHITHDHASGRHHVHVVNEDGTETHSDHASPEEAHMQAANAAGVMPGDNSGNSPMKHHPPETEPNPDSTSDDFEPDLEG